MTNSWNAYYDAFKTIFKDEDGDEATFDEEHSLDIDLLIEDGHELANHSMYDWPYNKYTKKQFENLSKLVKITHFFSLFIN